MCKKNIPEWAKEEAVRRCEKRLGRRLGYGAGDIGNICYPAITELAATIAKHEQPPVNPLLIEAREFVARAFDQRGGYSCTAQAYRNGEYDSDMTVKSVLLALESRKNS